jgi:hypothetical protein
MALSRSTGMLPLAFLFLAVSCSEPSSPADTRPLLEPLTDTTSHDYTWEFYDIGEWGGSHLRSVAAESDTNVWAVGDIYLGFTIETIPTRRQTKHANVVHITGSGMDVLALDTPDHGGTTSYSAMTGVVIQGGVPIMYGGVGWTKSYPDSLAFRYFRERLYEGPVNPGYRLCRNGDVMEFACDGWMARYLGMSNHRFYNRISSGTTKDISAFAEIDENEFYIGGWDHDSPGGIFLHWKDGKTTDLLPRVIREGSSISFATAIWAGRERLYAQCATLLYTQSIRDPERWDTLYVPAALGVEWIGHIMCANGRADNDVFFAGHYGNVIHFNGKSLHQYKEVAEHWPDQIIVRDIALTPDRVFLVGNRDNRAALVIGTRVRR